MNLSIRFTRPTVKSPVQRLKHPYALGDLRLVRRISALLGRDNSRSSRPRANAGTTKCLA